MLSILSHLPMGVEGKLSFAVYSERHQIWSVVGQVRNKFQSHNTPERIPCQQLLLIYSNGLPLRAPTDPSCSSLAGGLTTSLRAVLHCQWQSTEDRQATSSQHCVDGTHPPIDAGLSLLGWWTN